MIIFWGDPKKNHSQKDRWDSPTGTTTPYQLFKYEDGLIRLREQTPLLRRILIVLHQLETDTDESSFTIIG